MSQQIENELNTIDTADLETTTGGSLTDRFNDWKKHAGAAVNDARHGNVPGAILNSARATWDTQKAKGDVVEEVKRSLPF